MHYFVDTNIPIGYTIPYDKWHDQSVNFIENISEIIYWSNLVKKEYETVLNSIIDDSEIFLDYICKTLKENEKDFLNFFEFEEYLKKCTIACKLDEIKKTKILEKFWMECNITEGLSYKLPEEFIMFSENLNMIYFKRDMKLKTNLVLHDCGLDNYRKYYDYAVELYHKGIHQPDCKIIVDAHDCGLTNNNLIFVSNDRKMVENISKIDASYLHIVEFRTCN